MSVRDVEDVISRKPVSSRKGSVRKDPNLLASEQLLEERLGTKVHITQRGGKGTITIAYFSSEELQRILRELT